MSPKKRGNIAQELADAMAEKMMARFDADHGLGTYILDENRQPVAVPTLEWARWFDTADRHVAETFTEHYRISTIFLGLDHSFGRGRPVLYETMVFGKNVIDMKSRTTSGIEDDMDRYCTWEEAQAGHDAMVRRVLEAEQKLQSPEENKA